MNNQWNTGQVLFAIQLTLLGLVLTVAGGPVPGVIVAVVATGLAFQGLIARPRTGP